MMQRALRAFAQLSAILLVCLPIAVLATLALTPFWSWLERAAGVESIGHSGPAEWCYYLVYALSLLAWLAVRAVRRRKAAR
ncbi:MAG: hypothetical protein HOP28_09160 [Gemmatimonadales bacterium]|nr:hypothetical protein [Gemmatimonadales bacterium]